ncbi:long-chain fatty acid--CoA ligase [Arthrobacter sp. BE255]|uniref:AMP-dependent synthetase/ligase n=1 Tax=Arthrobacter sp. BE255 TaxID=2817721 RepID=UPI002859F2C4|nr:long-chain fatty acid--CoA ligase [Arthrobacter sp. BE255]MDR7159113.1 long-subunit acyl-CoA synthetase (AMP-forming) [Arthrobacter sp. BE255]
MQATSTANAATGEAFERALQAQTVCEAFQITAAARAGQVALRTPDGSVSVTYGTLAERVRRIAAGLAALGVRRGDTVGIMLTNRPEFHIVDLAVMHLGAVAFSVYNTSAPAQIAYMFADAGNKIVITETDFVERIEAVRDDGIPIDRIIVVDGEPNGTLGLDQLEKLGDPDFDLEAAWSTITPDDLLTLIYTSGTTGSPKGVELSHGNMMSEIRGLQRALPVTPGGRTVSFLPAAHIGDRWSGHYSPLAAWGFTVTCCADPRALMDVVKQVRPTMFLLVPRIWEKAKAALEVQIETDPGISGTLMRWAIGTGIENARVVQAGKTARPALALKAKIASKIIGSKIREELGLDQAAWFLTGSAPTPPDVFQFFAAANIPICEIWAMSESSCLATVNPPEGIRVGTVGVPIPGVEVKVAEDGELLIRGGTVMQGYRNKPEQTAEALDADGWLHTGDIGAIDADGYVRLVDRKKEIIINSAGKNMSPANIETWLKSSSPLIGQAVCVGDGRPYNVALFTLDPDGAAGRSIDDPDTIAEVAAGVERANTQLSRVEQIKKFKIVAQEWLPGSEELTPTMKIKRRSIISKYAEQIDELYAPR